MQRPRSSRQRYRAFVDLYRRHQLDDAARDGKPHSGKPEPGKPQPGKPAPEARLKRRQYLREYVRWLRPHRLAVGILIVLALLGAGLDMASPLFMRFIIDRVLLNPRLPRDQRFLSLNAAGTLFLVMVIGSNLISAFREY